jgi:hypothetical protein
MTSLGIRAHAEEPAMDVELADRELLGAHAWFLQDF